MSSSDQPRAVVFDIDDTAALAAPEGTPQVGATR